MSKDDDESRARLELEANRVRSRLMDTLDVIDRRRHDLLDVRLQLRQHTDLLAKGLGGLALLIGGGIALGVYRSRARRQHLREERMRALTRFWQHPDRIAREKRQSMLAEIGRKLLVGVATFTAMQLVKRQVRLALPEKPGQRAELIPHRVRQPLPAPHNGPSGEHGRGLLIAPVGGGRDVVGTRR
jgi:hypothetical protein